MLPGTVQSAPAGVRGFDIDSPLTSETAAAYYQQDFRFCLRYISLQSAEQPGDLTSSEAETILNAGLSLMPVQHVAAGYNPPASMGWAPSESLGNKYGTRAAAHAQHIGFPSGVNVWCDLEAVTPGTAVQAVVGYCNAWSDAVRGAGFVPGLYVGVPNGLNSQELYEDISFEHYWRSLSASTPSIDRRGYQMVQQPSSNGIDENVTHTDNLGGQVLWLSPSDG